MCFTSRSKAMTLAKSGMAREMFVPYRQMIEPRCNTAAPLRIAQRIDIPARHPASCSERRASSRLLLSVGKAITATADGLEIRGRMWSSGD